VFAGASAVLRVFTPGEVDLMRQGARKVTGRIPGLGRLRRGRGREEDPLVPAERPLDAPDGPPDSATQPL
jgi:hypothetical protein